MQSIDPPVIAVVIPCYRVREKILDVLAHIGPETSAIYVIDDHCPEGSGEFVAKYVQDSRVELIRNTRNLGVGGAVIAGYKRAIAAGATVIVKLDGDGQMDPALIPRFVAPILSGDADYSKGNRFYDIHSVETMPTVRKLGNLALSFFTKLSSGYWELFDPTNGYTAIHSSVARELPLEQISERYFFESDMLFRLKLLGAVVCDIPMAARYGDEQSNLDVVEVIPEFLFKNMRNATKRILISYFLRDFNIASMELLIGGVLLLFGASFGIFHYTKSLVENLPATAGTVMVAALPILVGVQMLLSFINFDISWRDQIPLHKRLASLPIRSDGDDKAENRRRGRE